MATDSALKKVGVPLFGVIMAVVLLLGLVLFSLVLFFGMVWVSAKFLPRLLDAGRIAFDICVLVLLPLCIFRKTRPWAGLGYVLSSFLFGVILFALSCIVCVQLWGFGALFLGLLLAGGGVVPVALLAAAFHGAWPLFWDLVFGVVLTFGTRYVGSLLQRVPEEETVYV